MLLCSSAQLLKGPKAPPQSGARNFCHHQGFGPARAGAALFRNAGQGAEAAAKIAPISGEHLL